MERLQKRCINCSITIIKPLNFGKRKWEEKKYCSIKCSSIKQKGVTKLKHTEDFKKQVSERHKGKVNSFETRKKMAVSKKGDSNPNWKGGISTKYQLDRASMECKLWRISVFDRDNYTCIFCFKKGGWSVLEKRQIKLNADHIKPFIDYPELRFAIDNGRTLCEECHRKTDTYGARSCKRKN